MPKTYHTNIPASYLVLLDSGKVLLSRRANTGFCDGQYSLPAGHLEPGETFTNALVREVAEEIGIVIDPTKARVAHIMHRKSDADGSERVDIFFVAERWTGEIENREPEKCDDLSWFPLDQLPDNTIPYIRQVLGSIQEGKWYSEFGW